MLDEIDHQILRLLQQDGRLSHAAIGKEIGLTGPSVYARIQRLERDGVITGYSVKLDPEKLGRPLVAIVRVETQTVNGSYSSFERLEKLMLQEPEILECYDVAGEDSYILKIRTGSPETLRELLKRIYVSPGVARTVTSIALATIKEVEGSGPLPATEPKPERATP